MKSLASYFLLVSFSLLLPPVAARAGLPGLVGYWSFDDSTAADGSGFSNDGTIYGPVPVHGLTADGGNDGAAFAFDGIDDYIDLGNPAVLNPTEGISVSAWYLPVGFDGSGNDAIVDKPNYSYSYPFYQYHLGVTGDQYWHDQAEFNWSVCADGVELGVSTPPGFWIPGEWYHLVGTFDGATLSLYVNATLVASQPLSGVITDFGQNLLVGKKGQYPSCLPGTIDEVRIYDRALSEAEVDSLFGPIAFSSVRDGNLASRALRVSALPNPTRGALAIVFDNSLDAQGVLSVFDPAGREVRRLVDGRLSQGLRSVVWDGLSDAGTRVPTGVYLLRLSSGRTVGSGRVVVLR